MFVGENGTGKSTLLEAIAIAYGFNPEGGSLNYSFSTRDSHANLSSHLTLEKYLKAKDGFFLRAESFYNLSSYIDDNIYENALPGERKEYGSKLLHEQSHGESFINQVAKMCHRTK